jgi:hypothetical protein
MKNSAATAAEKRRKYNLLHERFPKLGAPLMVVLVCFAHGGRYIFIGRKLLAFTSTSNMVLIDVAPSVFTNRPN